MFQNPYAPLMGQQNQQFYNQPYQQQIQNIQQEPQNLIRVNGIEGARAYNMPPNSTVALFDGNEDIMYIKTTDGAGFASTRKFSFTEISNNQTTVTDTEYISRQEFEDFKKELRNNVKQSISKPKSNVTADKSTDN